LHYLTQTRNYYLAHLALSCPILSVIAHYFIGTERDAVALKHTLLFGMFTLLPFLAYLVTLYLSAPRMKLVLALTVSSLAWLMSATVLTVVWKRPSL
jgi:membrane protein GlpM